MPDVPLTPEEIARGIVTRWVRLFMPGREASDTPSPVLQHVLVSEIAEALDARDATIRVVEQEREAQERTVGDAQATIAELGEEVEALLADLARLRAVEAAAREYALLDDLRGDLCATCAPDEPAHLIAVRERLADALDDIRDATLPPEPYRPQGNNPDDYADDPAPEPRDA